ncbi:MAG: tetratricopeptide repeat protein [Cytophagales bacterium]|nr:tetratricopeptide repeat protein [Cytophagales bacterium]
MRTAAILGFLWVGLLACRPAERHELQIPPLPADEAQVQQASLTALSEFVDDEPRNSVYLYRRALLYERMRRYGEALRDVNRAIENRRTGDAYGRYYVLRGRLYLYRNRVDSAYADAVQSEKLGVQSAAAYLLRGQMYTLKREYEKATEALQIARQMTPFDPQVFYWQANAAAGTGDTTRALDLLQESLAARPDYIQAYNRLAEIHVGLRDLPTAKRYAFAGLRLDSTNIYLNNNLGRMYRRTNEPDSALAFYRRSLARDTSQHTLNYEIAAIHLEKKRYWSAIPYLERLVKRPARYPDVPDLLAVCYDRTGQERTKLETFELMLAADSTDTQTQRLRAALTRRIQQRRRQAAMDSLADRRRRFMDIQPVEIKRK